MKNNLLVNKNIAAFFPKDSEAMFNRGSLRTFGGSTIHLYQFVKELNEFANIFTLLPNYDNIEFNDSDKFSIIRLYNETDNPLVKFLKFRKFTKKYKIKIVMQLGLTVESCLMAFYCYLADINFVFLFAHDIESLGLYQNSRKKCFLFPLLIKFSSILITQNEIEKENILNRYPELSKIKVLKKGIDFERIQNSKVKLYDGISIARCEEWKNIEAYLDIVRLNSNYNFLLIAPPVPGKEDYYHQIKKISNQFQNLTFHPFVPYNEVYRLLSESKVIFVTSDMEGDWPLTVIEAAATGLPVISLNYSYGNLVEGYKAGFFCDGSTNKMNDFFQQLMHDIHLLATMSENARSYANNNHNSKHNAQKLIDWFKF